MSEIADGWVKTEIVDILAENNNGKPFQQGWSPQCESHPAPDGDWGVLKTTAIQDGEYWGHQNKRLPDHLEPKANVTVNPGDILMTCAGPRNRCGVTCLVERTQPKLMMSGKMYRFRPLESAMDSKFLTYFLATREATDAIDRMKTGINDSGLNLTHGRFAQLIIRVAPLNEQRRIVEKIEQLFDLLDKGEESLRVARDKAGLYRQSLLKHAFEGHLTADWRAANPDKLESPETLLARIQEERDARYKQALDDWQDALTKWRADGEEGKKPAKPKRLPATVSSKASFPIPGHWFALPVGSLGRVETGATPSTKVRENFDGNVPFFKPTDLEAGADVREAREFLSEIGAEKSRPFSAGAILVTCIGATIGKTGLSGVDAACNQQINFIEPDPNFEPKFIYYQILSPFFQDQIKDNASSTTLPILNKGKFSQLPTIVCSRAEQAEIVSRLEAKLSTLDALEADIDTQLARSRALRQSILKRAFEGKLVPQDPTDEPASALLDRIKAERDAAPKAKRRKVKA